MAHPTLSTVTAFLNELLPPHAYLDSSQNGLQVDAGRDTVTHVAFAVDAGESVIAEAVSRGADLLVVHHGLLWSTIPGPITGPLGRKVKLLIEGGCSLYGSHLPLDGHQEVGNGAQIAHMLGLHDIKPFCFYKGGPVGCWGRCPQTMTFESVSSILQQLHGASPHCVLPFGKSSFSTVAIVTGSGSFALEECARANIDLLISGEPKHEAYHLAKELHQSALFAGHYATETVGVLALKNQIEQLTTQNNWTLRTSFIDEPSGI
jgi:dinuclear metal center YbgI/SA1388 family protein